jgi:hypothetical protein
MIDNCAAAAGFYDPAKEFFRTRIDREANSMVQVPISAKANKTSVFRDLITQSGSLWNSITPQSWLHRVQCQWGLLP